MHIKGVCYDVGRAYCGYFLTRRVFDSATTRREVHKVAVRAGVRHTFIAYAQEMAYIGLYVFADGKPVERVERQSWFPSISYTAPRDGTVDVYVAGPDEDVTYTFLDYVWDVPRS